MSQVSLIDGHDDAVTIKPCPVCGQVPEIGYACGEHFIMSEDDSCPCCGIGYSEMHTSKAMMVEAWNRRASNE